MWSPTHVQVLVKKARGLKIKGKDGTNDAFVTIGLGKEKYQTSVKEKATEAVEWCEQCELTIPTQGNTAEIVLTALHRNFLGVDEFLGLVIIPLRDFDSYDRPRTKWYPMKCKPGQSKNEYRGELEVRTSFTVKAVTSKKDSLGSTSDLGHKSKHKGSLQSLNKAASNFGGSLLNLGQKEKKHLKKIAKSVTHKVEKVGEKAKNQLSNIKDHSPKDKDKQQNDKLDNSLNRFSDPLAKIKGAPSRGSPKGIKGKNLDPGVNSDDEDEPGNRLDDDMFSLDALSHGSSGSSLNVGLKADNNIGTVSKTSTPMSGSFENLGGGEFLRRTPLNNKRSFVPQESPLVVNSTTLSNSVSPKVPTTEDMDEWELKLLGKKGVPYVNSADDKFKSQKDNSSILSFNSGNSNSKTDTLERPKFIPDKSLDLPQETPNGHKKKIIPVHSDFESSPSPEDCPSSPSFVSKNDSSSLSRFGSPFASKDKNRSVSRNNSRMSDDFDNEKKKKFFGKMGKSSLMGLNKTASLLNLNQMNRGFRGDKESNANNNNSHKVSTESLPRYTHSRTLSDGSAGGSSTASNGNPPSGPRVVLGRETTPTTGNSSHNVHSNGENKIPREVWDRYQGKSREDLIEIIVNLQTTIEHQARKQSDLEDYIDSLLMKVLSTAPQLLQKNTFEVAGKNSIMPNKASDDGGNLDQPNNECKIF